MITKGFPIAVVIVIIIVAVHLFVVIVVVVPVVGIADVSGIRHNLAVASSHLIFNIIAYIVNINMFAADFLIRLALISLN